MGDSDDESYLLIWKAGITASIIISALVGVWFPKLITASNCGNPDTILSLCNAFAGGVVFGVSLIHILPEAVDDLAITFPDAKAPYVYYCCVLGFMILVFVENMMLASVSRNTTKTVAFTEYSAVNSLQSDIERDSKEVDPEAKNTGMQEKFTSYALMCALCFHSVVEGFALGMMTTISDLIFVYIAIISHKAVAAFALGTSMNKAELSRKVFVILSMIFTMATPLGVVIAVVVLILINPSSKEASAITALTSAVASGTFLYIATIEIFAVEFHTQRHFLPKFFLATLGIVIMALVSLYS